MFLSELKSLKDALSLIEDNQKVLGTEKIFLKDAHKRVLAEKIVSFHDFPPFDKSTRDGFAIKSEDTAGIDESNPKSFKIIDSIGAGSFSDKILSNNEAIQISTGAPIPDGADAVVMKENVSISDDEVKLFSQISFNDFIYKKGEDIKKGDLILQENTLIGFQEIGLIASAGYNEVEVYKKPNVKLIITGNELVQPSKTLEKAKIINSNQFTLASLVKDCGANVEVEHVKDDIDSLTDTLNQATKEFDIVMTTGGTAISKGDLIFDVVDSIGDILFRGVEIRPGKLFGCGIVNDTMVFNFSGRPSAAMTQFDIFARKYIFKMQGIDFYLNFVERELMFDISSKLGMVDFLRSYADDDYIIELINHRSDATSSIIDANSYILIDKNIEECKKGDLVKVLFFNSMTW